MCKQFIVLVTTSEISKEHSTQTPKHQGRQPALHAVVEYQKGRRLTFPPLPLHLSLSLYSPRWKLLALLLPHVFKKEKRANLLDAR